jgi:hypothetical protein
VRTPPPPTACRGSRRRPPGGTGWPHCGPPGGGGGAPAAPPPRHLPRPSASRRRAVEVVAIKRRVPTTAPPTPEMKFRFGRNLARCREDTGISQERAELPCLDPPHRGESLGAWRAHAPRRHGVADRGQSWRTTGRSHRRSGWRPGYEIVVPGSWEVVEREGQLPGDRAEAPVGPAEVGAANGSR